MAGPTPAGYLAFLRDVVRIPEEALPDDDPVIEFSYNYAINTTLDLMKYIPQTPDEFLYSTAIYNLATHILMVWAHDQPGSDFFQKIQKQYQLHSLVAGAVKMAKDESTSTELKVPSFFNNITFSVLDYMKTPWGRMYLEIAQSIGSLSLMNIA